MLQCQPGKLGCFLGGQLLSGSSPCTGIDNARECRPAICKPSDNERDKTGMTSLQRGIDGRDGLSADGALYGGEQLQFGCMNRRDGATGGANVVGACLAMFGGLPVFEGSLARPVQGSRYWSRSHPLPRSRSFQ